MKIAYLTNHYPAVSHSFIRREIEALEALGVSVDRYSVRESHGDLPDARDRAERERTHYLLRRGAAALLWSMIVVGLRRPGRFARAKLLAFRMAEKTPGSLIRHVAYLAQAAMLTRALRDRPVHHLHVHFGTNPTAVARLLRVLNDTPYSFTAHGPDEFDRPIALDLRGKIADSAFAVGVSSFGRSQLMRWSDPKNWHKIAVVHCSVDADYLGEEAAALPVNTSNQLCCVARLSAQKGLPLLIEAAALLRNRGADFHLRLVGDGEMRLEIEAQIAAAGLQDRISITGWCDGAAVRRHLSESRAMVMASFAEGLPVVLMEALALGRPVIATAIAGIPELVDQDCGWLVKAGSPTALADAMQEALRADPATLQRLGETGRRRVTERHAAIPNGQRLLARIRAAELPA